MKNGIRFFNVVWRSEDGNFAESIEAATSRRSLSYKIERGEVARHDAHGKMSVVKAQEIETPMIEVEWLLRTFTSATTKADREAHKDQAAYILRLVESCAARLLLEDGETIIER